MIERQTARKVRIASLTQGKWMKQEGMDPSFVVTPQGEKVARARVLGTVVGRFIAEDATFASVTLDDGTDTLRAKTFKTAKPLDTANVGDILDVIGKVREWNGEIYMIPEVVSKVENPNIELLRRLEIAEKLKDFDAGEVKSEEQEKEDIRQEVLLVIEKEKAGISYDALLKAIKRKEQDVEKVINDLLSEGVCYEPTPGKIRKI